MPNHASVATAVLSGVMPVPVTVEAIIGESMPSFDIVGIRRELADELRAVVRCAILASGFEFPNRNVTVTLSPLDLPKRGAHLALPIAIVILQATGQIHLDGDYLVVGELSLSGQLVQRTRGVIAYARYVQQEHMAMICPSCDALPERYMHRAQAIHNLRDLRTHDFWHAQRIEGTYVWDQDDRVDLLSGWERTVYDKMAGPYEAGHSILIVGPHERTQAVYRVLRAASMPLESNTSLECAAIADIAGDGSIPALLSWDRPIRNPDPSISPAALLGGGMPVRPGEISLAHNGILFLDDLAQWKPSTLRQIDVARRDGHVRIVRQDGVCTMPSEFQLVACIAPCPCGHYGDPDLPCSCEVQQAAAWQRRIEQMSTMFDTVIHL